MHVCVCVYARVCVCVCVCVFDLVLYMYIAARELLRLDYNTMTCRYIKMVITYTVQ